MNDKMARDLLRDAGWVFETYPNSDALEGLWYDKGTYKNLDRADCGLRGDDEELSDNDVDPPFANDIDDAVTGVVFQAEKNPTSRAGHAVAAFVAAHGLDGPQSIQGFLAA